MKERSAGKKMDVVTLNAVYAEIKALRKELHELTEFLSERVHASERFKQMLAESRAYAKAKGFKEDDVVKIIHRSRGIPYDD